MENEQSGRAWAAERQAAKKPERSVAWGNLSAEEQANFLSWGDPNKGFRLHNVEMEQALLGNYLVHNEELMDARDLEPEHFFEPLHSEIFEAMIDSQRRGRTFSPVTLGSHYPDIFDRYPDTEGGGPRYLVLMAAAALHVINTRDFVDHIIELAMRRDMAKRCIEAVKRLQNPGKHELRDVAASLIGGFLDATEKAEGVVKVESFNRVQNKILARLDERSETFSTRIACLDKALGGGFYGRKSYCFMARPKNGKTMLMSTIYLNLAMQTVPVLYVCCEMGDVEIHQRNMARMMGVPSLRFITHKQDIDFVARVLTCTEDLKGFPGYFADANGITFDELRMLITSAITRYKIRGFFLDYIGLVEGKGSRDTDASHQERIAKWIAAICKKHDIFCGYAAQTNREGHLRGSDAAIMNADVLYEITLEAKKPEGGSRHAFLNCHAHRYMPMHDVGSADNPALRMHSNGPHFKDADEQADSGTETVYTSEHIG